MNDSSKEIISRLRGKRFGVIGVGNTMRGDDGAGPALVAVLEGRFSLPMVDASEVPENYGGWVVKKDLGAVVFVDAVEFGAQPGCFRIIPLEMLMRSASSTHRLSLHYTVKYMREEWDGDAILIGVQPKSVKLGDGLSDEVSIGVKALSEVLIEADSSG